MRYLIVVVTVSVIMLAQAGGSTAKLKHDRHERAPIDELLADLRSDDIDIAGAAEQELHRRLNLVSDELTKVIAATHTVERNKAMQRKPLDRALGVMRRLNHREFTHLLMMNVTYFDHSAQTKLSFTGGYPCATMLCGLGPSAAYEIVKYLDHPPVKGDLSDEVIDLFAKVLLTVFSSQQNGGPEEAKAMLVRARRRVRNTEHLDRLDKAFRTLLEPRKQKPPAEPNAT